MSRKRTPERSSLKSHLRKALCKRVRTKRSQKTGKRKSGGQDVMSNMISAKKAARKKSSMGSMPLAVSALQSQTERRADIHPLDRAIAELRSELARNPDEPTILSRLAALFYRRGDLAEAERRYLQAIALTPHKPSLHNNLGNVLCDMGRMRDGIAAYENAMALERAAHPEREEAPEAKTNLELARMEYRLVHERIEYLERASQLDISSAEALNALGCGYLLRAQRQKALDTFRKASVMDPRNRCASLNIAFTHTLDLGGSADLNAALAEVAEAIIRFPNEGRLYIHQGELQENAGLLEGAEERYLRALQADPRCLEAYDLLGRLREAVGLRHDTTLAVQDTLRKLEPSPEDGNNVLAEDQKCFDRALVVVARARFMRTPLSHPAEIDAALRRATSDKTLICILRSQLLEFDGRRNEARMVLDNACKSFPHSARCWFERGGLALRAGDVTEAVEAYERATLCAPEDAVPYHFLRFAFEGYRRYRTERVRFENATKENSRDGLAHHHLAMAALSVLKDDEALFHFTRALELDPRLSDAACGRGRALQRLGHLEEAESAYAKALDIDPQNPEAQRSLMGLRSQKILARNH